MQGHSRSALLAAAATVSSLNLAYAAESTAEIYGFAFVDLIQDFNGRLAPEWDSAFRPSRIGIDGQFGDDGQSTVSVKQSRLGIRGLLPIADGQPLSYKVEFDLFGTGDDAGKTTPRLRHFFGEWGSLLAGQTDTLFMDGDVFPNTIDAWGPTGMVFYRNAQLRWTPLRTEHSRFAIALERPSDDIDPGNLRLLPGLEGVEVRDDEKLPDLTAQFRYSLDWGHVQLGGILRRVGFELRQSPSEPWISGSETGWGLNLSSAIALGGNNRVLLQAVYGEGIASYMNDGGMDLAPSARFDADAVSPQATAIPLLGIMAYYDHWWSPRWSSSIGYSFTRVNNTNFQTPDAFSKGQYASVNLLHFPNQRVMLGAELMWGQRENNDGSSDDALRLQFSVKYSFGINL
ncbi:MAG: DcaP family trimeric outer membrane transporter [Wenzhouxiangella sp.]